MVNGGDKTAVKGESISKNRALRNGDESRSQGSSVVKIRDKNSWTVDALFIQYRWGFRSFAHSFAEEFFLPTDNHLPFYQFEDTPFAPIRFPGNLRASNGTIYRIARFVRRLIYIPRAGRNDLMENSFASISRSRTEIKLVYMHTGRV